MGRRMWGSVGLDGPTLQPLRVVNDQGRQALPDLEPAVGRRELRQPVGRLRRSVELRRVRRLLPGVLPFDQQMLRHALSFVLPLMGDVA